MSSDYRHTTIPFDQCRCLDERCEKAVLCARYLCRTHGPRSPWADRVCAPGMHDQFISVTPPR